MVYTQQPFDNNALTFPKPPMFLTWTGRMVWNSRTMNYETTNDGQIRHHLTLYKARRYLGGWVSRGANKTFHTDWALYEWDEDRHEYKLLYSGKSGEKREENQMYKDKIKPGPIPSPRRPCRASWPRSHRRRHDGMHASAHLAHHRETTAAQR